MSRSIIERALRRGVSGIASIEWHLVTLGHLQATLHPRNRTFRGRALRRAQRIVNRETDEIRIDIR